MNLSDIRQGIADQLGLLGIEVKSTIPSALNSLPAAIVALADGDTDQDFGGGFLVNWTVLILLTRVDDERAQQQLDEFLSTDTGSSIHAAIYDNDSTLGGTVDSVRVTGWQAPSVFDFAGTNYVGVEVGLETLGA